MKIRYCVSIEERSILLAVKLQVLTRIGDLRTKCEGKRGEISSSHILRGFTWSCQAIPALTFSRTLAGILRGWDLTIERNEELHLWQSIIPLFLSVSATIFCENFVTNLGVMHGRLARWRKWRDCDVGETKEGLENELWRRWSNGRVGEWVVT